MKSHSQGKTYYSHYTRNSTLTTRNPILNKQEILLSTNKEAHTPNKKSYSLKTRNPTLKPRNPALLNEILFFSKMKSCSPNKKTSTHTLNKKSYSPKTRYPCLQKNLISNHIIHEQELVLLLNKKVYSPNKESSFHKQKNIP